MLYGEGLAPITTGESNYYPMRTIRYSRQHTGKCLDVSRQRRTLWGGWKADRGLGF